MKKKLLIGIGVIVVFFVILIIVSANPGEEQAQQVLPATTTNTYSLELLSSTNEREFGYITTSGEIKNISGINMSNVVAVVSYYTTDGAFVKSDDALIDYNPILANQTSPFEVITTDNPLIKKFKVEFQIMSGGTILTKDSD